MITSKLYLHTKVQDMRTFVVVTFEYFTKLT